MPEAPTHTPSRPIAPPAIIGTLLCRFAVPVWVLIGAAFKLRERNPKLLPEPVRESAFWIFDKFNQNLDGGDVLLFTLRFLVAVEIILACTMIFIGRLSRTAAIFTLLVFVTILTLVLYKEVDKAGFSKGVFEGSCGCFGSSGPKPYVMFLVDCALLFGVIMFKPIRTRFAPAKSLGILAISTAAAFGIAFGIPDRQVNAMPETPPATTGDQPPATAPKAPSGPATAASPDAKPWPVAPKLKSNYFEKWEKTWPNTRLDSHALALQISRPMPADINSGTWYIVFYRDDCDVCHALLSNPFFKGENAKRTIAARFPDSTEKPLPFPCKDCLRHDLPKGPGYVITTPVLVKVIDGIVVSVCTDTEDEAKLKQALDAKLEGSGPAGNGGSPQPNSDAPKNAAGAASATGPRPWPPAPTDINSTFSEKFETWMGQRLDSKPLALLISRPLPADINQGVWYVMFFRGDCDHCHELLEYYIAPDPAIASRTIVTRVPDTDPNNDLAFPCPDCKLHVLPGSEDSPPYYVFSTPVLLKVIDGVVKGVCTDSEDGAQVDACLNAQ